MTRVYVGNLSFKTNVDSVRALFDGIELKEAKIVEAPFGKSRGFGFVTLKDEKDVEKALAKNDVELDGRKVRVEIARPEDQPRPDRRAFYPPPPAPRYAPRGYVSYRSYYPPAPRRAPRYSAPAAPAQPRQRRPRRDPATQEISTDKLFVKNLSFQTTDEAFKQAFEKYDIADATIVRHANGRSKGFGFVTVKSEDNQKKAIAEMNEFELDGRKITVSAAYKRDEKAEETATQ